MDLEEFLRRRGEKLIRSGRDKRLDRDHSVTIQGNRWYDHATERGGGPISFVEWFYDLDYVHIGTKIGELYESEDPEISPILLWDNEEDSVVCSISAFLSENELVKMAENVEKIYLN